MNIHPLVIVHSHKNKLVRAKPGSWLTHQEKYSVTGSWKVVISSPLRRAKWIDITRAPSLLFTIGSSLAPCLPADTTGILIVVQTVLF